jgi:magnesium chelatase subunit I
LKRAIRLGEKDAVPRVSDLGAIAPSTTGKIELEAVGEASDEKILGRLVQRAVLNVFKRSFAEPELADVVKAFEGGLVVQASDAMPSADYVKQVAELRGLRTAATKLGATEPAAIAAAIEFVLEGLHLGKKLNKDTQPGGFRYRG